MSAQLAVPLQKLINSISYSQFKLLVDLDDNLKRAFYEVECVCGNWSVRELKRQINSLYYERSGLSIKGHVLVEYALAGMDNRLFVSRYQLELPSKEDMQRFLEHQISQQS